MRITLKNQSTRKFQVGGAMPEGAPMEEPVDPISAIACPLFTCCPTLTFTDWQCA